MFKFSWLPVIQQSLRLKISNIIGLQAALDSKVTSEKWFVDSLSGLDTNNGKTANTAFKTISKLLSQTILPGAQIYLARGSQWREWLNLANFNQVNVFTYGQGARPLLNCADVAPNANFSLVSGQTNTYQIAWTPLYGDGASGGDVFSVWQDGIRLVRRSSIAAVESNPGSFFAPLPILGNSQLIYVHATQSSNPATNGRTYEITKRPEGLTLGNNCSAYSIHTKYNGGNNGSLVFGENAYAYDCLAEDGTKHNTFARSGIYENCKFWKADIYRGQSYILAVFYAADIASKNGIFKNCIFMGGDGISTSIDQNSIGIYSHGPGISDRYNRITVEGCSFYNLGAPGTCMAKEFIFRKSKAYNCLQLSTGNTSQISVLIEDCELNLTGLGGAIALSMSDGITVTLRGIKLYWNTGNRAIVLAGSAGSLIAENNTIIGDTDFENNTAGIYSAVGVNTLKLTIQNNVFSRVAYGFLFTGVINTLASNNNIWWRNTVSPLFILNNVSYADFSAYRAAFPNLDVNSQGVNPGFIGSAKAGNFKLSSASAAHTLKAGAEYWTENTNNLDIYV